MKTQPQLRYTRSLKLVQSLTLAISVLITTAGCQFAPKPSFNWFERQTKKQQPTRILPVWTDTVLYQTNQAGVRGFGGRIYFYEEEDTEPIEVEGGVAVYVFDADNDEPQHQKPLRKFVFTGEQFASHMSRTSIGPSYSVWLPWGEVGGPPLRLSLIARFEGTQGGTVISDPTIKLLPGVPVQKQAAQSTGGPDGPPSQVRLATHSKLSLDSISEIDPIDESMPEQVKIPRRLVGTIDLPPSFQRHLFHQGQAPDGESQENAGPAGEQSSNPVNLGEPSPAGSEQGTPAISQPSVASTPTDASMTTTVIDYRSRRNNSASEPASYAGSRSKRNIREGKWLEPGR